MSIIDTLSAGFNTVTKKLWLLVIPVLLDLGLWLGPKLSIAPILAWLSATFQQAAEMSGDSNAAESFGAMLQGLQETVGRTNLLSLISWGRLGVPSIAGLQPIDPARDWVIEVTGYGQMLLLQVAILGAGLLIACFFLGMLGQVARGEKLDLGKLLGRAPLYWLRLLVIFIPLGMFLVFVVSVSLLLGILAFFLWLGILWMLLYLAFVPQAVTLSEERPLGALMRSFIVMRLNFWPALGLILLVNVIGTGLGLVLQRLVGSPLGAVGMFLAIVLNAYIGTGLTLALFIFYRDRLARWREWVQQQRGISV